jgi:hypothetical protein
MSEEIISAVGSVETKLRRVKGKAAKVAILSWIRNNDLAPEQRCEDIWLLVRLRRMICFLKKTFRERCSLLTALTSARILLIDLLCHLMVRIDHRVS